MGPGVANSIGIKGYFTFEVFKADWLEQKPGLYHLIEQPGSRRVVAKDVPNQILDAGRNYMGTGNNWAGASSHCQVGTNSTDPTSGDTQLLGYVNGTNNIYSSSTGAQASPPYYSWDQRTYRFVAGEATGNLSEAGVGWSSASGAYLVTRALIRNISGTPTTITVLADEWLDVTYQLRYYPPLEDVAGTVTLDGTVYDTVTRAALVTTAIGNMGDKLGVSTGGTNYWTAYDGTLGLITQAPNGNDDDADNAGQINLAYQNNSYQQDMSLTCGINGWNLGVPGIRCILINTNGGRFQTQFSSNPGGNTIPKDTNYTLNFVWRLKWGGWYWGYTWNMEAASDVTTPTAGAWNTNVAGTLLRINWDDSGLTDHQNELQVESNTLFRIVDNTDATKWIHYRGTVLYSEGTDWTEYTVTEEAIQNGGPGVGNACTITAVDE